MKKKILLLLSLFGSIGLSAQSFKRHTFSVSTAMSFLVENNLAGYNRTPFNMPAINYKNQFSKNFALSASISKWTPYERFDKPNGVIHNLPSNNQIGTLRLRENYIYFDLEVHYLLFQTGEHETTISLGPSLARGDNYYIASWWQNPSPPYDVIYSTSPKRENNFGFLVTVNYSIRLFGSGLVLNPYISSRYYPGIKSLQYDLGARVGWNFNFSKSNNQDKKLR